MSDCLIVGGGVIGLSLAYELAGHGWQVRLIDAGQPGREASWAGAGILPPASAVVDDPLQQLTALSNTLHVQWSEELRAATGIDNGFRRSGAIYLARDRGDARQLAEFANAAEARGIVAQRLTSEALGEVEPALEPRGKVETTYLVPAECQIRNPRHLKALLIACANRGVEIISGAAAEDFDVRGGRIRAVQTNLGMVRAQHVCITTGAWTRALATKLSVAPAIKPIRGQIVLVTLPRRILSRIVNEGSRYLVPRCDGRVLIGSTEEDVGFDRGTTAGAVTELLQFAMGLVPALESASVERYWAGLRPSTRDGLPYLGKVPGLENAFVAAGHFRGGLQLSTGTAVVMSQLIRGARTQVDLTAFSLERHESEGSSTSSRPRESEVPQR